MLFASFFTSIGQLLWKISNGGQDLVSMFFGFFFYGLGAVAIIIAFRYGSLSVLHPMQSLSYIYAIIMGSVILKEDVNLKQMLSIFVIMAGVVLIGGGDD